MTPRAHSPRSLDEALALLGEDPLMAVIAGGTDWMVRGPLERAEPASVLDLLRIEELHGIEELHHIGESDRTEPAKSALAQSRAFGDLRIGATTTFREIQDHPRILRHYPILAEAAAQIGARQIQNRATLGGNIVNASPAGDSLPVLLALNAQIEIANGEGTRRVSYDTFHTGYRRTALGAGELLTAVILPPAAPHQRFRKVGTRRAQAISKVVVAMTAETGNGHWSSVRIAAGSVAPTPVRLRKAEAVCEGAPITIETALESSEAAYGEVAPIDDLRSTAHYRRWALARVLRRMMTKE